MCPLIQPHTSIVITMARLGFALRWLPCQVRRRYRRSMEWCYLLYFTLFFNYFTTWMIVFETALEPMFWFVDKFAKCLGPIFVTLVVFMTTSVVTIFYVCLLPHVYSYSVGWTVFHLIFGHWLLINIVFHYIMAVFTQPGNPPKKNVPEIVSICKKCISPKPPNFLQNVPEIVSICKKCISPKPPRTHHCTVCGKCILKMDHHCPWLNNCVGHYNHRYFFLFCVYMWLGTIYVSWVGHELFRQHFYGDKDKDVKPMMAETESNITTNYIEHYYHVAVLYEFILCSGVTLALGLLMLWHAKLISSGETSIEVHINRKQEARYKKKNLVYKNPYNYGFKKNWQEFLGINGGRSFIRHVLLPSSHDPEGNGLTWSRALYKVSETNGFQAS